MKHLLTLLFVIIACTCGRAQLHDLPTIDNPQDTDRVFTTTRDFPAAWRLDTLKSYFQQGMSGGSNVGVGTDGQFLITYGGVTGWENIGVNLYQSPRTYAINELVVRDGLIYRAKTAGATNPTVSNTTNWELATKVAWSDIENIPVDIADGDDVLSEAQVDAFVDDNGYLENGDHFTLSSNILNSSVPIKVKTNLNMVQMFETDVSEADAFIKMGNITGNAGKFIPLFHFKRNTSQSGFGATIIAESLINDGIPSLLVSGRTAGTVTTNPLFRVSNLSTQRFQIDASGNVTWSGSLTGNGSGLNNVPYSGLSGTPDFLENGDHFTLASNNLNTGFPINVTANLNMMNLYETDVSTSDAFIKFGNITGNAGKFIPTFHFKRNTQQSGFGATIIAESLVNDGVPSLLISGRTAGSVTTNPILRINNLSSQLFQINSNGHMGVLTTAPTAPLDVNGTVRIRSLPNGDNTALVAREASGKLTTGTNFRDRPGGTLGRTRLYFAEAGASSTYYTGFEAFGNNDLGFQLRNRVNGSGTTISSALSLSTGAHLSTYTADTWLYDNGNQYFGFKWSGIFPQWRVGTNQFLDFPNALPFYSNMQWTQDNDGTGKFVIAPYRVSKDRGTSRTFGSAPDDDDLGITVPGGSYKFKVMLVFEGDNAAADLLYYVKATGGLITEDGYTASNESNLLTSSFGGAGKVVPIEAANAQHQVILEGTFIASTTTYFHIEWGSFTSPHEVTMLEGSNIELIYQPLNL